MALIGREIIQTRIWSDEPIQERKGNYKEVYPITIYEAVKKEIGSEQTLAEDIEWLRNNINSKQLKLPAKGADQIVTYGGHEGEVGSIGITTRIRVNETSNDLIPTEKAVENYLVELGFVDAQGNVDSSHKVRWANIIGRPMIYSSLGFNQDGFMTQDSITREINSINNRIDAIDLSEIVSNLSTNLSNHTQNRNNPHQVTLEQLEGVSLTNFNQHIENTENPHQVTKAQLGLENVNNTSDLNKPISTAMQNALDALSASIIELENSLDQFDLINTRLTAVENHLQDTNNPHQVTIGQLNGVSLSDFNLHLNDFENPHRVTKTQVGLSNVDNTSDLNKPISNLTQAELDLINSAISDINDEIEIIEEKQAALITTEQLSDSVITTAKLADDAVTLDKIASASNNQLMISKNDEVIWDLIGEENLKQNSISSIKIKDNAITTPKIANGNIDSDKLAADISLFGNPTRFSALALDDDSNSLVTSEWVNSQTFGTDRIINHSITGDKIFTTNLENSVLAVIEANSSPIYSKITHLMLNDSIIETNNIKNLNVTEAKLADDSVSTIKLKNNSVTTPKILDGSITTDKLGVSSVTSEKIFRATDSGMVLISDLTKHPVYTRLTENDIDFTDHSIPVNKLESIDQPDRILAVITNNTDPIWTKVNSDMLRDKIVDGSKLFTSPVSNRVLAVEQMYEDAFYTQVNTDMIKDEAVTSDKIAEGSILYDHLGSALLESDFIATENIQDEAVTGVKLFRSELPNRVIGTIGDPYSSPRWVQVNRDMIRDEAVNGDKLWTSGISENPYRVIGVTGPDVPPEYLMITGNFIVNDSIPGNKLMSNLQLSGTPTIEINPPANSRDHSVATTGWLANILDDFQNQITTAIQNMASGSISNIPIATDTDINNIIDEVWTNNSNSNS